MQDYLQASLTVPRLSRFLFLALLSGCIGASGHVTPQGADESTVVLAVPLDRPYAFRQPAGDSSLNAAGFLRGQVVSVHDGDSIGVLIDGKQERVRLIGIDVPELGQAPWDLVARDALRALVSGKTVRLETDVTVRDQYFLKDSVITFNYDVLLDHAMDARGASYDYCFSSQTPPASNDPPFKLLKLHGSITNLIAIVFTLWYYTSSSVTYVV